MQTEELIETCLSRIKEGEDVWLRITGNSMTPFLVHARDSVCLSAQRTPVRRGDMVLFARKNGSLVLHRICKVKAEGIFLVGDGQTVIEGPVAPEAILARVNLIKRKGKTLSSSSFWWLFFKTVWLWILPFRPAAIKLYCALRGNYAKQEKDNK